MWCWGHGQAGIRRPRPLCAGSLSKATKPQGCTAGKRRNPAVPPPYPGWAPCTQVPSVCEMLFTAEKERDLLGRGNEGAGCPRRTWCIWIQEPPEPCSRMQQHLRLPCCSCCRIQAPRVLSDTFHNRPTPHCTDQPDPATHSAVRRLPLLERNIHPGLGDKHWRKTALSSQALRCCVPVNALSARPQMPQ